MIYIANQEPKSAITDVKRNPFTNLLYLGLPSGPDLVTLS